MRQVVERHHRVKASFAEDGDRQEIQHNRKRSNGPFQRFLHTVLHSRHSVNVDYSRDMHNYSRFVIPVPNTQLT
jgi:hypothetical protein